MGIDITNASNKSVGDIKYSLNTKFYRWSYSTSTIKASSVNRINNMEDIPYCSWYNCYSDTNATKIGYAINTDGTYIEYGNKTICLYGSSTSTCASSTSGTTCNVNTQASSWSYDSCNYFTMSIPCMFTDNTLTTSPTYANYK